MCLKKEGAACVVNDTEQCVCVCVGGLMGRGLCLHEKNARLTSSHTHLFATSLQPATAWLNAAPGPNMSTSSPW